MRNKIIQRIEEILKRPDKIKQKIGNKVYIVAGICGVLTILITMSFLSLFQINYFKSGIFGSIMGICLFIILFYKYSYELVMAE